MSSYAPNRMMRRTLEKQVECVAFDEKDDNDVLSPIREYCDSRLQSVNVEGSFGAAILR